MSINFFIFGNMKNQLYFLLLITVSFLTACDKKADIIPPLSDVKEITEFKLDSSLNSNYLKKTIAAVISEGEINLQIPQVVDATKLVASFTFEGKLVAIGGIIQQSGVTPNDFTKDLIYTVNAEDGSQKNYKIKVNILPELLSGVPHFYINTENGTDVTSKDFYLKATIKIDGAGVYDNYEGTTSIKGRGNSTLSYPKKPYRLKLDSKAPLLGLSAEKDWILLANYLDVTLMSNAIAFKAARLFDMPFTNTAIPVDVTINGEYRGNYTFTEQKEVEDNRINVGAGGVLLEFDTYYDETYKFRSGNYDLPVMIQYPKLEKMPAADADVQFEKIKTDFGLMENAIASPNFPNNNYLDYIDGTALVRYLIVYDLMLNEEINHPKSTYLYKHKDGKYKMGPVWDFDWALGYEGTYTYFGTPNKPLFWNGTAKGTVFFKRLMTDPAIRSLYKKEWNQFKSNKLPQLHTYIDDYAKILKVSYQKNYALWKSGSGNLELDVQNLHKWFNQRAAYLDTYVAGW